MHRCWLALFTVVLLLTAGCGQKGPLHLPDAVEEDRDDDERD